MSQGDEVDRPFDICVIGAGYIGLPTSVLFAQASQRTLAVDTNPIVVDAMNQGTPHFSEPGLDVALRSAIVSGNLIAHSAPKRAHAYVITVPTPLTRDKQADLSYINAAIESIAPLLLGGDLVIIESTCPPGTTLYLANSLIERRKDLTLAAGTPESLYVAHCPERVSPGRTMVEMIENDRIVGGINEESTARAIALYKSFCSGILLESDSKTAELSKLAENSYRDVNIAFANELSQIADHLGADVWEVIALANRHPRVNILQPGPGVGGHCIAVDPWFIHETAPEEAILIRTARAVNDAKPSRVSESVLTYLKDNNGKNVAVLGLTFKANVDDLRGSPSVQIVETLADRLPEQAIFVADPHVSNLPESLALRDNVTLSTISHSISNADVVLLLVDHVEFRTVDRELLNGKIIFDTKGFWK